MKPQPLSTLKAVLCVGSTWGHLSPVLVFLLISLLLQPQQTRSAPGRAYPSVPHLASPASHSSTNSSQPPNDVLNRLSKVFGISRIPRASVHRSPPQYMKELYAEITDTGGLSRTSGPYNSNVIRSFPDKGNTSACLP